MPNADSILETKRLLLRALDPDDLDAIFAVIGDPLAMQHYAHTFDRKDAEEWIERNLRRYAEQGHGLYAVVLKTSGDVIGDCGLVAQQIEGRPELEVGYHLRRDQWGHGYATEAAHGCMEYAFSALNAQKVISLIRPENLRSRRVAERNGMQFEREVMHSGLIHLMYATSKLSALNDQPSAKEPT